MKITKKRGFTLIELMIVIAIIAIIAAIAIPNLIEARKHGNEAAAIGALKTTNSAETLFREGDKEQNGTLDYGNIAQLSATTLIDGVLGSTKKQGYVFNIEPASGTSEFLWFANANPAAPTSTGDRYFCTNHSGVIYYTAAAVIPMLSVSATIPTTVLPVGK